MCVLNQLMKVLFRRNLYISGSDSVMILGEQQLSSHTTNSCDCDTQVQAHQTTPASVKGELDGAGRRSGLSGDTTCDLWGGQLCRHRGCSDQRTPDIWSLCTCDVDIPQEMRVFDAHCQ